MRFLSNEKTYLVAVSILAALASGSVLAAKAQQGYLIFNKTGSTYTKTNPTACNGIVFPASVAANTPSSQGAVIQVSPVATGYPCTTVYTDSTGRYQCTVTLSIGKNGAKMTASPSTFPNAICSVSNAGTVLTITGYQ
ncbi:MAG: hypothetical protein A3C44_06230 [Gammaproteobacteria bacterium RIFCSPHIGHO2_02_FULL_39_13]|nr:MAG: hypothetical protein A3C44_06230 [Gammaproteobacteria bacterium RIFCSPHIGHO2_02_FULL_39_13]OGT49250.1 MAG: hypothetical protein A3E53_07305 [Gammaproteobacteria bacterium RIFCSPHIGHO2_12_FULL_39_24]